MTTPVPANDEWKIEKRKRRCSGCEREFGSEERHLSSIHEADGGFARRDTCLPCWEKQGDKPFSFWETVSPRRELRSLENIEAMTDFFKKLIAEPTEDENRLKIIYLTALLLMRKRRVKALGSKARDGRSRMTLEKAWDGETTEIVEPAIPDGELATLKAAMEALFSETMTLEPAA